MCEDNFDFSFLFDDLPKEYITMLNADKYRRMLSSARKIKDSIDRCVSEYDETAEYSIKYSDLHSVLLSENVSFCVRIPQDVGVDIAVSQVSELISEMDKDDTVSIEPCADGRIDMIFCFKKVYNLLSAK